MAKFAISLNLILFKWPTLLYVFTNKNIKKKMFHSEEVLPSNITSKNNLRPGMRLLTSNLFAVIIEIDFI